MKINLIPIGNSKGVRLPKTVIEQCGFADRVELRVINGEVILSPARSAREGWDTAFEQAASTGDDTLLIPDDLAHDWDESEWTW